MTTQQGSAGPASRIEIDAEDLITALQSHDSESEYFLDRSTGEIVFLVNQEIVGNVDDELREVVAENPDRFLSIEPTESSVGWQIMADFIEQLPSDGEAEARERLTRAVQRNHPFRRFKDELTRFPHVRESWFAYEYDRMCELAREWLKDEELEAELKTRRS